MAGGALAVKASSARRSADARQTGLGLGQLALDPGGLPPGGVVARRPGGRADDRLRGRPPRRTGRLHRLSTGAGPRPSGVDAAGRARASRSMAGARDSNAGPSAVGIATSTGSQVAGSRRASERALRMPRTRSISASSSASAARSRSPTPGQRATMSSGGSRCAMRQRRPDGLRDERHHRVEQPQVGVEDVDERPPGRLADLGAAGTRPPAGPWRTRGPSRSTRSRSRRTGRASPRRRRSRAIAASTAAVVPAARDRSQRSAGPDVPVIGQARARRRRRSTPVARR